MARKYEATGPEAEFEPGSRGRVLRNLLGITRVREMNVAEARSLQTAMDRFVRRFDEQHRFTADDVRDMHRAWLGVIYEWAGEYRSVKRTEYFAAIHAGMDRNYGPMAGIFDELIERSLAGP